MHEIGRDNFSGGAYFTLSPIEWFTLYGGYSYKNESSYIYEASATDHSTVNVDHVFNASFEATPSILVLGADLVCNAENDIYAAVRVGANVTDKLLLKVEGLMFTEDVAMVEMGASGDDSMYRIYPDAIIDLGKWGELEAGAEIWFEGGDFAYVEFPVYWSYSF